MAERPKNRFESGQIVTLRSGGEMMTVLNSGWSQIDNCYYVKTVWMNVQGDIRQETFPECVLDFDGA